MGESSPAIDAGNPAGCTDDEGNLLVTDQRGPPRPDKQDMGGRDIGAYENETSWPGRRNPLDSRIQVA